MQTKKCPRCGYDNVPLAGFCFQCGRQLNTQPFVNGLPGTGKLVEQALRFIKERGHTLEPGMIERLREARAKLPPEELNGEPLICLRCGTFNLPSATTCTNCGSLLVVPDMDFNLVASVSARTSVGQVRANNEDHVSVWGLDGVFLGLIADGLGGALAGEEASRLAVEAVQASFLGEARGSQDLVVLGESTLSERLVNSIQEANRIVFEKADVDEKYKGMGTTATLALIRGNRVIVAHVGDSRAYLVDKQERQIHQITTDHTFVQALVASGHLTPEQAKTHPMGNVLYRALGQSLDLEVDVETRYLKEGDCLILCSDGLTRHLATSEIAEIVLNTDSPEKVSLELVELANSRGGEDNISVIVAFIQLAPQPDLPPNGQ